MTTLVVDRRYIRVGSDQSKGWLVSVLLHGLGIAAALFAMEAMERPRPPSLFQWEISMVEAPTHTESQPTEPVVQPSPPISKPSPPMRQTKPVIAERPLVQQEVTVPVETTQMVKDVVAKFGKIDILVNNAGVLKTMPMFDLTPEHWDWLQRVNQRGLFFCLKAVALQMIAQVPESVKQAGRADRSYGIAGGGYKQFDQYALCGGAAKRP
ncbi:SDR family oxidoreductase [candidate division KSB1 bacterium]|nr:SDR family oxidoreductase [candidate division KSB1 bacterium]